MSDVQSDLDLYRQRETDEVPAAYRSIPDKITPKQREFLLRLIEERDLQGVPMDRVDSLVKSLRISEDPEEFGMSKAQASQVIEWFLGRPKKSQTAGIEIATPDVPAGRYAVLNDEGVLRFYTVDRPTEGRWAGYVFVSVWASDERHPVKGYAARNAILNKIKEAGVQEAAERFGREIGQCSICGRTLTDETSRSIGIGPVCREKTGWYA